MPSASERTAIEVKPGLFARWRTPNRMSRKNSASQVSIQIPPRLLVHGFDGLLRIATDQSVKIRRDPSNPRTIAALFTSELQRRVFRRIIEPLQINVGRRVGPLPFDRASQSLLPWSLFFITEFSAKA